MEWDTTGNIGAAVAIRTSLDDGSWAIVGDRFSESDVSKRIDPERRKIWNHNNEIYDFCKWYKKEFWH